MIQSEIVKLTLNRLQNFDFGETAFSRPALLVKESSIKDNGGRYLIASKDTDLTGLSAKVVEKVKNAFLQSYNGYGIEDILLINWKDEETLEECLNAMETANPKQYWALCSGIEDPDFNGTEGLKPLIQFCIANDRFYFMANSQIESLITTITAWKNLKYSRVFALFSNQENCDKGIDLALASILVANTPGNLTAKFKSLVNFTPDDELSTDEKKQLKQASINMYVREGSRNSSAFLITEGVTIDSDYFDFVFGLDYMQVQVVGELRNLFLQAKNIDIGFNSRGYALIKSSILTALNPFVSNEFIDPNTTINITEPANIDSTSFSKRILNSIAMNINLIQKIHFLNINLNAGVSSEDAGNTASSETRSIAFSANTDKLSGQNAKKSKGGK